MELLLRLDNLKKSYLWISAVVISIMLTEMIVVVMDMLLKGQILVDDLITGLVASGLVASLVIGAAGFFLQHLAELTRDNCYLTEVMAKLDQITFTLATNDEAYRNILATSLDGFWLVSADGRLLDVNQRYCDLSGYTREELLKMRIINLEGKENFEENLIHLQYVIENGSDQFETAHLRKDGSLWHVEVSTIYSKAKGGLLYTFLRDITERKQAEKSLRESQEMLRAITDNSNAMIFIKDINLNYLFVNSLFEQEFKVSNALIAGKNDYDIFPQEFADKFIANDKRILRTGVPFSIEETAPHEDGIHTYISVKFPLRNANGEIYAVCGIATDITERKKLELEREQYFTFFQLSRDLQGIANEEGYFVKVNPAFSKVLGYSEPELLTMPFIEVVHPDDRRGTLEFLAKHATEGSPIFDFENRYVCKDGTVRWMSWKAVANPNDELIYATARDITRLKRQQEEIRLLSESELNKAKLEAERANQAKSDFLASMSHELFTPMNAVLGFAQLLANDDLTQEQKEYVNAILTGGYKLLDLIKEVLDFSLVESEQLELKLKKLDLAKLVQGCIKLMQPFATKNNITLVNQLCENCYKPVLADSLRLKQIVLNLLSNAIKYNRENGRVTISCACELEYVKICIADTGKGLSNEQIEKLFLPFERLSAKNSSIEGAGLGLCISKKLIEAMGGKIGVNSISEEGSQFWIEIPLASSLV